MGHSQRHDAYAALRYSDYALYMVGNVLSILGVLAQEAAIGWELYDRTGSAMALGLVGLVQVAPVFLLTFVAGHVADRFDRRRILMVTQVFMALASLALAWLSYANGPVSWIYVVLFFIGVNRAFLSPAAAALLPQLVPEEHFENAVTWQSTGFQVASVAGPALGGLLIAIHHSATDVYLVSAGLALVFLGCASMLRGRRAAYTAERMTWQSLVAGFQFVMRTKIILATITMDMFAVLLGGATTLLPIFAKELGVGPTGYGWLRAAPSAGAFLMAVGIAHLPPMRKAGKTLLWAVAGFGAATIVFGLSKSFALSMAMLFLLGGLDAISVVVRSTLVQVRTPDALRGRVSAVNSLFIGTSNELGGFESGAVASLLNSAVASVVLGGIGTILVVLGIAWKWPEVRRLGRLREEG